MFITSFFQLLYKFEVFQNKKFGGKNFTGKFIHTHIHVSLYLFVKAAITKYQRLAGLNDKNVFLTVLQGRSQRPRCLQVWFLLRLADGCLLAVSSHGSSLCVPSPGVFQCTQIFFSYKDNNQIGLT